jgi:hypothetical protein
MPVGRYIEKFPTLELQELRDGLLQQGLDSWQAADLISSFLAGRGYGVSRQSALDALLQGGAGKDCDGDVDAVTRQWRVSRLWLPPEFRKS